MVTMFIKWIEKLNTKKQTDNLYFYYKIIYYNYSFSKIAAAPIPVPIHIEIHPYCLLVHINSCMRVATYLAPVHPKGCPNAIAPPFGFTLE